MACPGLATQPLAGLCALWVPSTVSSSGNLHKPAKPQHPQTTYPARPQPPVQAPPHLPHSAGTVFDHAVPHGMPRAGHSYWQGSVRCGCRVLPPPLETSTNQQNRNTHKPPAQHCRSPQCWPHYMQSLRLTLQCPTACPGLATHTLAVLCALWLPSGTSMPGNLHHPVKPR